MNISRPNRLTLYLWLLTIVPVIIVLSTEANKKQLIGYMRLVDFVDLVVTAPFFLLITLAIHAAIFSEKTPGVSYWGSLVLIGILLYGHAMHMTANSINTFSTEIHNYRNIIPNDTYALIYFLDENLGHWLLYLGLFGLLGLWTWYCQIELANFSSLLVSGSLFGVAYGIAMIESSQAWLGPVLTIWLLGWNVLSARNRNKPIIDFLRSNPMAQFTALAAIFIMVGMSVYFAVTGGFIEPSKYGL